MGSKRKKEQESHGKGWTATVIGSRVWRTVKPIERFLRKTGGTDHRARGTLRVIARPPSSFASDGYGFYLEIACWCDMLGVARAQVPLDPALIDGEAIEDLLDETADWTDAVTVDGERLFQALRQADGETLVFSTDEETLRKRGLSEGGISLRFGASVVDLCATDAPAPIEVPENEEIACEARFSRAPGAYGVAPAVFGEALRGAAVAARGAASLDHVTIERRPRERTAFHLWVYGTDTHRLHHTDLQADHDPEMSAPTWDGLITLPLEVSDNLANLLRDAVVARLYVAKSRTAATLEVNLESDLEVAGVAEGDDGTDGDADAKAVDTHADAVVQSAPRVWLRSYLYADRPSPSVETIIDSDAEGGRATLQAEALLRAIAIARIGDDPSADTPSVEIDFRSGTGSVTVRAESSPSRSAAAVPSALPKEGGRCASPTVDPRYLVDALKHVSDGSVHVDYKAETDPLRIRQETVTGAVHRMAVVSPKRRQ